MKVELGKPRRYLSPVVDSLVLAAEPHAQAWQGSATSARSVVSKTDNGGQG